MRRVISFLAIPSLLIVLVLAASACGGDSGSTTAGAGGSTSAEKDDGNDNGNGSSDKLDACAIVTQSDATAIFGNPAVKDSGADVLDPNMLGECLWGYDTDTSGQLIQFRVWDGSEYYSAAPDSTPFDLGEQSYISVSEFAGVDIEWVQDGKTVQLSYFTTGPGAPEASTKVEEVKQLAKKAAAEL